MTTGTYFLCGCALAAIFGAAVEIEDGDHKRVVSVVIVAALWPFSIALGASAFVASLVRDFLKFIRGRTA